MSTKHPINEDIQTLEQVRAETRIWSIGSLVATVVILVVGIGMILSSVNGLAKPGPAQTEFSNDLVADLNQNVVPTVQTIAGQAVTQSQPAMQAELSKMNTRLPEVSNAFMEQVNTLQKDLPDQGEKILSSTLGQTLKDEEPKIKAMYPDVTDQNISDFISNITDESATQIDTASQSLFAKHVKALNAITADLNKISSTEPIAADEDQANLQMAVAVVGAFDSDLTSANAAGSTSPSSTSAKKEKK